MQNYYQILGVSTDASDKDIQKRMHEITMANHPDIYPGDKKREEILKEASIAYHVLSKPEKRRAYDNTLRTPKPSRNNVKSESQSNFQTYFDDFARDFYNSYKEEQSKKSDKNLALKEELKKLEQKINQIDTDVIVLKRSMSNKVANDYNSKVEALNREEQKLISDIGGESVRERNKKRFISTFFSSVDTRIIEKYAAEEERIKSEYQQKRSELEQEWKTKLEKENSDNKEKQDKIDKLMASKKTIEDNCEKIRQTLYPKRANSNLHGKKI